MAFVTDSNRPQPPWQPPPTACLTASGAASEAPSLLLHPCPDPPPLNPPSSDPQTCAWQQGSPKAGKERTRRALLASSLSCCVAAALVASEVAVFFAHAASPTAPVRRFGSFGRFAFVSARISCLFFPSPMVSGQPSVTPTHMYASECSGECKHARTRTATPLPPPPPPPPTRRAVGGPGTLPHSPCSHGFYRMWRQLGLEGFVVPVAWRKISAAHLGLVAVFQCTCDRICEPGIDGLEPWCRH